MREMGLEIRAKKKIRATTIRTHAFLSRTINLTELGTNATGEEMGLRYTYIVLEDHGNYLTTVMDPATER